MAEHSRRIPKKAPRLAAAVILALTLSGCGGTGQSAQQPATTAPSELGPSATLVVATAADGATVLSVQGSGKAPTRVTVTDGGTSATVTPVGSGWATDGREVARIKADDDSVKLRDPSGATLWKIKYKEKIKITKGEETETCELSQPEPGRWKAKAPDGRELGQAKKSSSATKLEGPDGNVVATSPNDPSPALAAWACQAIPPVERAAIIGELVRRPG